MIKYLSVLLLFFVGSCGKDHIEECPCYTDHQYPHFKGCEPGAVYDENNNCDVMGLYNQLYKFLKYPQEAINDSVQGRVTIAFDIYENGSIGNYTIFSDTLGHGLANAAIEAIKTLNDRGFCPARENCEPVVYHYILPVLFVLH